MLITMSRHQLVIAKRLQQDLQPSQRLFQWKLLQQVVNQKKVIPMIRWILKTKGESSLCDILNW
ncbi:uncharacterized protein A4U43_C08F6990 [Asparagus officinalis]|nr:uncharacterized protein A4U43_C08F6990 [Asparagus officinalis]